MLILKLTHLCLWFHRKLYRTLRVKFMSDDVSDSFEAGLTIHVLFQTCQQWLEMVLVDSFNPLVPAFVSVDQILYNIVRNASYAQLWLLPFHISSEGEELSEVIIIELALFFLRLHSNSQLLIYGQFSHLIWTLCDIFWSSCFMWIQWWWLFCDQSDQIWQDLQAHKWYTSSGVVFDINSIVMYVLWLE